MKILSFVAFLQLWALHQSAELGDAESLSSVADLKKFPISTLKKMLSERGLECKGCADKEDYIKMAFDNQHLPVIPPTPIVDVKPEKDEATKKKELDDIMESFKKGGFGGAKMFTKDDLEGLSAEDMAQKFGDQAGGPPAGAKRRQAKKEASNKNSATKDKESSSSTKKEKDKKKSSAKKDKDKKKSSAKKDKDKKKSNTKKDKDKKKSKLFSTPKTSSVPEEEHDTIEL